MRIAPIVLAASLALGVAGALAAQEPQPAQAPVGREPRPRGVREPREAPAPLPMGQEPSRAVPDRDPIMGNLFPPDLIMQNQDAIGLTDEQRNFMMNEVQRTQAAVAGNQWRLQASVERLGAILRDRPDETQALAQLDEVLALEHDLKRAQLGLLVRLKSHLTADQQAALRRIRPGPPRED